MQNLYWADTVRQEWANYPGPLQCLVTASYQGGNGHPLVDVQLLRSALLMHGLHVQTPFPSVGDVGFVVFLDLRRDTPVFVGVISAALPFQSATVDSASATTLNVTVSATGKQLTGVPFLLQPSADTPAAGDAGVIGYLDGLSSKPFYLGKLSS